MPNFTISQQIQPWAGRLSEANIQLFQKYQKNTTIASEFSQRLKKAKKVIHYCLKFVYI